MRLPKEELSVSEQLKEFDQWLTPKLGRIKDSERFQSELVGLCQCIEALSATIIAASNPSNLKIENLINAVLVHAESLATGDSFDTDENIVCKFLSSFFDLLFLTTGATDNNLKNHFRLNVEIAGDKALFPKKRANRARTSIKFRLETLPSVAKSQFVASFIASTLVGSLAKHQKKVTTEPYFDLRAYAIQYLRHYTKLVLEDKDDLYQFWAVCKSYLSLKNTSPDSNLGIYLLNSCTVFKVRGSVTASGGHVTEDLLREKLIKMGLRANKDFNVSDATHGMEASTEAGARKSKTRAYDFIIPYSLEEWEPKPKLFIQAQFYAGDSGSVSHKVVDQTRSSREQTLSEYPTARFIEYLDGAGYYAALRGDLEHMLTFQSTHGFFQVKSIWLRLRRELQGIDLVTPLEIQHAILLSQSNHEATVIQHLLEEDYPPEEVHRSLTVAIEEGKIEKSGKLLSIPEELIPVARRTLILDTIARLGDRVKDELIGAGKLLTIPGFGPNFGIVESILAREFSKVVPNLVLDAPSFTEDIEWLIDEGVVKRK
jgi:hypothetical protein